MANIEKMRSQLEQLQDLRANGVRSGRFGEDSMEYRSDSELANAIADLERRIAATETSPRRIINPNCTKGY